MMLPKERQAKIREWLESKHSLKISELSKWLGVSEMTVHRDLKPLIESGVAEKVFGGIALARPKPGSAEQPPAADECALCQRKIEQRLAYRLILEGNRIESTCCAHCGLLRQKQWGDQVIQAICYDFLSHTTVSARTAWYVLETSIDIRCCQPQVLTFERRNHAEGIVKGFGGIVMSFEEALAYIDKSMGRECPGCS
ncbi:DeoR family transcriptional regulator [Brevibacillus sp. B_LB10_24]|uniref:DeoR family transcriptional regulator n=1 Tax=Brevibacillus TaxID=55080 RepID=UPI0002FCA49C|nr:DeoR family transcriptional regulator [Brevibacillus massiliensis]